MKYDLITSKQRFNDNTDYLIHKLPGETPEGDRHFFGQRIPSYGIINFGAFQKKQKKRFTPIQHGIERDISARSIFSFTTSSTNDEFIYRLLGKDNSNRSVVIYELKVTNNESPYEFPPGAIINPYLTIEIESKYEATAVLLYWQPVHVLQYTEDVD